MGMKHVARCFMGPGQRDMVQVGVVGCVKAHGVSTSSHTTPCSSDWVSSMSIGCLGVAQVCMVGGVQAAWGLLMHGVTTHSPSLLHPGVEQQS
jgi:hypothetical protein